MSGGHVWDWVELANDHLAEESKLHPTKAFEPGDIAMGLAGSIHSIFSEYLVDLGQHPLTVQENLAIRRARKSRRYCIILERLAQRSYSVCFMTSITTMHADLKHFGMPMELPVEGFDMKPIRTMPVWEVASTTYVYAAPVVRGLLIPGPSDSHVKVFPEDLERIRNFAKERTLNLDQKLEEIRISRLSEPEKMPKKMGRPTIDIRIPQPVPPITSEEKRVTFTPFEIPRAPVDISWSMHRIRDDIMSRSEYLNQSAAPRLVKFNSIPKPYYSPSLKRGLSSAARLIHR